MLTFFMDKDNFGTYLGGGTCDGTRLVSSGVQLNPERHESDADTLALWHLSAGSWGDASGNNRDLSPQNGASLVDDGAAFVAAQNQYASAALGFQGRSQVAVELWLRPDSLPAPGSYCGLFAQSWNLYTYLMNLSGQYHLYGKAIESDGAGGYAEKVCHWQFPAEAPPETGRWYHLVLSWHRDVALRLFLDGTLRDTCTDLTGNDFNSSSSTFYLGRHVSGVYFDGTIDEVRVSQVVRYTADFQPKRFVATGTFDSPAFDAVGSQAEWLSLAWQAQTPETTQLVMMVRAGDQLDGNGDVQADWELVGQSLPPGRYLQWRTLLVRSTGALGRHSPTLESVTAVASQAGYNIYHGSGEMAVAIDYDAPIAKVGPTVLSQEAASLAYPAIHWFGVRSVNAWDSEALTVDAEVRLELDDSGQRVPPRPASVESLEAQGAGGGRVRLSWLSMSEAGEAPTDVFRIYYGLGAINYSTPLGEVSCRTGIRYYEWTSDPLPAGTTVLMAVRAETSAGGVDADPPEVEIEIDATAPSRVGFAAAATKLSD